MRFTFVILLFCCLGADAQMIIKAHANYRPLAQPVVNLLLDDYPNAAAAYSLRKLDKDYTGNAIRVRRSNDNSEQDIGFVGNDLDTASLKTFVGANNGFVTTWYDQSSSNNLTQTTATRQARIINAGVIDRQSGRPVVFFDGNDNLFTSADITHTDYSVFSAVYFRTAATAINIVGDLYRSNGVSNIIRFGGNVTASFTNERIVLYNAESGVKGFAYTAADIAIGSYVYSILYTYINTLSIYQNATNLTLQNVAFTASNYPKSFRVLGGGTTTTNGTYASNVFEFILYTSDQSSNRSGIETNINSYYGIY
jgi:hypothetical protein